MAPENASMNRAPNPIPCKTVRKSWAVISMTAPPLILNSRDSDQTHPLHAEDRRRRDSKQQLRNQRHAVRQKIHEARIKIGQDEKKIHGPYRAKRQDH